MSDENSRGFGSDNHAGVHPEVLQALLAINSGHQPSYETDELSRSAHECLRTHFGPCWPFFVFNGTAANVLALRPLVRSYEAVICASTSHLQNDECAAPEAFLGCKLLPLEHVHGKITPELILPWLIRRGDQHHVQPKVISIAQPTELGTVYTLEELRRLRDLARAENLYMHIDGARLVNAAAFLETDLATIVRESGADCVSFGGTKNGLLCGEAVIFFNESLAEGFKFYRKQAMQLPSKTRFIAAQFTAWLGSDLWLRAARHANTMAAKLEAGLKKFAFIEITRRVESNAVFARLPKKLVAPLRKLYFFYVWDEHTFETRLMTSFDTRDEDIDGFLQEVARLQKELKL